MHTTNNNLLGIIFMILAMLCLSVNDVNVKGLNNYFPVWEVIFFRAFSGLIISFILIGYFGVNKIKTNPRDINIPLNARKNITSQTGKA